MSNSDIIVSGGQKNDWDLPLQVKIEDVITILSIITHCPKNFMIGKYL